MATLKVVRKIKADDGSPLRRPIIQVLIAETGEALTGVQSASFKEEAGQWGRLTLETVDFELDMDFEKHEVNVVADRTNRIEYPKPTLPDTVRFDRTGKIKQNPFYEKGP